MINSEVDRFVYENSVLLIERYPRLNQLQLGATLYMYLAKLNATTAPAYDVDYNVIHVTDRSRLTHVPSRLYMQVVIPGVLLRCPDN